MQSSLQNDTHLKREEGRRLKSAAVKHSGSRVADVLMA